MKLRQKLAVVLASAMVVTAVPVVTMAASTVTLKNNAALAVNKGEKWNFDVNGDSVATAPSLQVSFSGHVSDNEVFYVKVEGAKYILDDTAEAVIDEAIFTLNADLYEAAGLATFTPPTSAPRGYTYTSTGNRGVTFQKQGDKEVKVIVSDALAQASKVKARPVTIPLAIEATDNGDIKLTLDPANSTIEVKDSWIVASASDKTMSYSVGDKTSFFTEPGKLAELTVKETYKDSMRTAGANSDKRLLTLELRDVDFNFYNYNTVVNPGNNAGLITNLTTTANLMPTADYELKRGFYGQSINIYAAVDSQDEGKLYIYIDTPADSDSVGEIIFKNLKVDCIVKDPSEGDFTVDIKSGGLKSEGSAVVMGEVVSFKNYIKMKDDKAKDVKAGRIEEIEFEVGEAVENTMITGRTFEVKLKDNAHFDFIGLVKKVDSTAAYTSTDDWKKAAAKLNKKALADAVIDNYNKNDADGDWKNMEAEFDVDTDGKAITDTLIIKVGEAKTNGVFKLANDNDQKDKVKFKVKVVVPLDKKDNEKVEVSASGRALENDTYSTTAINIINPIKIEHTEAVLKVGKKDQASDATYTITETDKEMFMRDGELTIKIKDLSKKVNDGLRIASAKLEVNGEIKRVKTSTNDDCLKFTFKRDSKAAASVKVSEITFDVDRTVPEGTYDIEIGGSALCQEAKDYGYCGHSITIEDAIKIGTPNTQDISAAGLAKGVAKFVIGESKYTLNDKEVTMDAPAYIQNPGYTMVPVRYAANAFGVADKDIIFGKGTVTIFAGERTISITSNSDVALVNGNPVTMGTKVVIKEGRTYAPAGEIARLLGIKTTWDSATKTATFEN